MPKNHRNIINACFATLCAGILFFSANSTMRDITTQQLVEDMGLGINIGNTFDAVIECDMVNEVPDQGCVNWVNSMATLEESWGSPAITRQMIQGYKAAGFKTVRVPVAWSNKMVGDNIADNIITCDAGQCISSATQLGGDYTISPVLLNRVQEVVDLIINEGMYVILNIHWDGGWWDNFPTKYDESMKKYVRIWEQVGERFKNYSDYLVFASLNEEGGDWAGVTEERSFEILNAINQAFVNEIRSQGGNNAERHLQIQGYKTNIDKTCSPLFKMPVDLHLKTDQPARLAVSVHYYDPFSFTHISEPVNWGGWIQPRTTWGTDADYKELDDYMDKMKINFVDKGIPVIIGEYGVASWDATFQREQASVRLYTLAVTEAILARKMHPVLWDVQLNTSTTDWEGNPRVPDVRYYYDRNTASFVDPLMVAGFIELNETYKVSVREIPINKKPAAMRPMISLRGKTLNVLSPVNSNIQVKVIDVKGKVRASFKSKGSASFSLSKMPAGKYFVEVKAAGVKSTSPIVLK